MKTKDLKINFRYLGGNIACLNVDSIDGESVHNDINNEEAIIIFNSLVGEKENCQTVKKILKENQQLKIQISAREEEYKKLENKLTETENWLRPAILQLMDFAKQDYYWITDQQIDNAKLVPIELSVMGDGCVKFKKLERGVSDIED